MMDQHKTETVAVMGHMIMEQESWLVMDQYRTKTVAVMGHMITILTDQH